MFFHTAVRVTPHVDAEDWRFMQGDEFSVIEFEGPPGTNPQQWLAPLFSVIRTGAEVFADMKNLGARIQAVENEARRTLGRLLAATAQREHLSTHSVLLTLNDRWQMRGFRRQAREDLALLWLAIANLEMLKRRWGESRIRFTDEMLDVTGIDLLFARDDSPEAQTVESLNLTTIQAAVTHLSGGLDTRTIALATIVGAAAGGLMGSIIG